MALWQSYNIASARLGLDVGYEAVENMFLNLGITKDVPNYPSLFIGSFELSPYQAIQAYQTIASDGFYSPLRSIRQIKDTEGKIEFSYPYSIDQTIRPEPVALLKFAMQQPLSAELLEDIQRSRFNYGMQEVKQVLQMIKEIVGLLVLRVNSWFLCGLDSMIIDKLP